MLQRGKLILCLIFLVQLINSHSNLKHDDSEQQVQKIEDLNLKVFTGVFLISIPSLPVFLLLQIFQQKFNFKDSILFNSSLSLCLGLILGDVFYHLLPELDLNQFKLEIILFGILLIWILEMLFLIPNKDNKSSQNKAFVFLLADFIHNFTDGIAIGASFLINENLGFSTVIATASHEIPHELSDFACLLHCNYKIPQIMKTQIFTSLGAFLGAFIGLQVGNTYKQELLALTIGVFLNNSLYGLLPEISQSIKESKTKKQLTFNLCVHLSAMLLAFYFMKFQD